MEGERERDWEDRREKGNRKGLERWTGKRNWKKGIESDRKDGREKEIGKGFGR